MSHRKGKGDVFSWVGGAGLTKCRVEGNASICVLSLSLAHHFSFKVFSSSLSAIIS